MLLVLDDDSCIVKYSVIGGLSDSDVVEFDDEKLPEDFDVKFQPLFYKLENDEIVENPDYVVPETPVIGPSDQDKINAQIMINQAKQKEEQDEFNAQTLLQLAKLGGNK